MKCWGFTLAALTLCACARPRPDLADSPHSVRLVATPNSIAALSAAQVTLGLPAEICFGGPLGRSALYLTFPAIGRERGAPQQAFISLSARSGAASDGSSVTIEAWRISSAWKPSELQRWSDKPELAPPYARAELSNSPAEDLRIDVTELLRFAARDPERDFGLALLASGSAGHGVSFATGMGGGRAPRLELFYSR